MFPLTSGDLLHILWTIGLILAGRMLVVSAQVWFELRAVYQHRRMRRQSQDQARSRR